MIANPTRQKILLRLAGEVARRAGRTAFLFPACRKIFSQTIFVRLSYLFFAAANRPTSKR